MSDFIALALMETPTMTLVVALVTFLVGVLVGSIGVARWWVWRMDKPEIARAALKSMYRRAHPNWLQISRDDTTRVCPCCGWSEKEGLAAGAEKCPGPPKTKA